MMEFFNNIYVWFIEQKDVITAFLSSGVVATMIGLIATFFKTWKETKNNTKASELLNSTIIAQSSGMDVLKAGVSVINDAVGGLNKGIESLKEGLNSSLDSIVKYNVEMTAKFNAMLEIQSVVYSTIKDEKIRTTVANLVANAKYGDTATREELESQIEALRENMNHKMVEMQASMDETIVKTNQLLNIQKDRPSESVDRLA